MSLPKARTATQKPKKKNRDGNVFSYLISALMGDPFYLLRQLDQANPLPFGRMESEPGQEAQVDFGQGAWVVEDGHRRRPHVLRAVLSHSRKEQCVVPQTLSTRAPLVLQSISRFAP